MIMLFLKKLLKNMEISVEGKQYRISVSKLFELVSISDKSEKREQEITDGYDYNNGDGTMHPVSKMIRDIKTKGNTNTDNIRDVIAFPKTASASDLMCETPNIVDDDQLKELHIGLKNEK